MERLLPLKRRVILERWHPSSQSSRRLPRRSTLSSATQLGFLGFQLKEVLVYQVAGYVLLGLPRDVFRTTSGPGDEIVFDDLCAASAFAVAENLLWEELLARRQKDLVEQRACHPREACRRMEPRGTRETPCECSACLVGQGGMPPSQLLL